MLAIGERLLPFSTSTVGRMIFDHVLKIVPLPSSCPLLLPVLVGFGLGLKEAITRIYSEGSRPYELQSFLPQCLPFPVALQIAIDGRLRFVFAVVIFDGRSYIAQFITTNLNVSALCSAFLWYFFGVFLVNWTCRWKMKRISHWYLNDTNNMECFFVVCLLDEIY